MISVHRNHPGRFVDLFNQTRRVLHHCDLSGLCEVLKQRHPIPLLWREKAPTGRGGSDRLNAAPPNCSPVESPGGSVAPQLKPNSECP